MVRNANENPDGDPLKINEHFCKVAALNTTRRTWTPCAVTPDELNRLLTTINAGYSTRLKHTAPLTQDEVNRLLAAIDDDNT
jgi:hypothetical protein